VEAHDGVVVKGLGDGVLARFGGAAAALAAAVGVQLAADSHSRHYPEAPLVLRVGVSAGDVALEDDGDLLGSAVIEAARLCGTACGGQILAAEVVTRLARGRGAFDFEAVGDLQLKGLASPVAAVDVRPAGDTAVHAVVDFTRPRRALVS
jgi:class 3 adenylate cyclase